MEFQSFPEVNGFSPAVCIRLNSPTLKLMHLCNWYKCMVVHHVFKLDSDEDFLMMRKKCVFLGNWAIQSWFYHWKVRSRPFHRGSGILTGFIFNPYALSYLIEKISSTCVSSRINFLIELSLISACCRWEVQFWASIAINSIEPTASASVRAKELIILINY